MRLFLECATRSIESMTNNSPTSQEADLISVTPSSDDQVSSDVLETSYAGMLSPNDPHQSQRSLRSSPNGN